MADDLIEELEPDPTLFCEENQKVLLESLPTLEKQMKALDTRLALKWRLFQQFKDQTEADYIDALKKHGLWHEN